LNLLRPSGLRNRWWQRVATWRIYIARGRSLGALCLVPMTSSLSGFVKVGLPLNLLVKANHVLLWVRTETPRFPLQPGLDASANFLASTLSRRIHWNDMQTAPGNMRNLSFPGGFYSRIMKGSMMLYISVSLQIRFAWHSPEFLRNSTCFKGTGQHPKSLSWHSPNSGGILDQLTPVFAAIVNAGDLDQN
jgi:hypothetical protein